MLNGDELSEDDEILFYTFKNLFVPFVLLN